MDIRKVRKADIEKIWEIEKESRKHDSKGLKIRYRKLSSSKIDNRAKSEFVREVSKSIKDKNNIFLVAEISGEVIGWIYSEFVMWYCSDNPLKINWIEDLGVLRKYQGKNVEKRLLKEIEKEAKANKIEYGYLTVCLGNKSAYSLYKKNGYEEFAIEMVKKF